MVELTEKTCSRCGEAKPVDRFFRRSLNRDGYRGVCKKCTLNRGSEPLERGKWERDKMSREDYIQCRRDEYKRMVVEDADALRARQRQQDLMRKYGITVEQYDLLLGAQGGACAICGAKATELPRRLDVDHCHSTGAVRGLLCRACNSGIGHLSDSAPLTARAAEYLEGRVLVFPCREDAMAPLSPSRAKALGKKYNLSAEAHAALWARQGGHCAICVLHESDITVPTRSPVLVVDHCHTTLEVRGLLCFRCNLGVGSLGDSPNRLARAASYLERGGRDVAVV